MCRNEWVHEGLEVGTPPLGQSIRNLPIAIPGLARKLLPCWCQPLVQPSLEAFDLVIIRMEIVARSDDLLVEEESEVGNDGNKQLEEGVCDLKHEDVGVVVLVTH